MELTLHRSPLSFGKGILWLPTRLDVARRGHRCGLLVWGPKTVMKMPLHVFLFIPSYTFIHSVVIADFCSALEALLWAMNQTDPGPSLKHCLGGRPDGTNNCLERGEKGLAARGFDLPSALVSPSRRGCL